MRRIKRRRSPAPRLEKTSGAAMQRSPGCLARGGRGGRRCGPSGLVGEASGGRWPWQRRAMATAALGCARGRENQGGGRARGRGKRPGRLRGDVRSIQSGEGRTGRQGGRRRGAVARARAGHTPLPLSGRRRQRREVGWAGAGYWAGQAAQGGGPGKFLLFISVFFSIFLTFVLI